MIVDIFKTSIYRTNVHNEIYKNYFMNKLQECLIEKKEIFMLKI